MLSRTKRRNALSVPNSPNLKIEESKVIQENPSSSEDHIQSHLTQESGILGLIPAIFKKDRSDSISESKPKMKLFQKVGKKLKVGVDVLAVVDLVKESLRFYNKEINQKIKEATRQKIVKSIREYLQNFLAQGNHMVFDLLLESEKSGKLTEIVESLVDIEVLKECYRKFTFGSPGNCESKLIINKFFEALSSDNKPAYTWQFSQSKRGESKIIPTGAIKERSLLKHIDQLLTALTRASELFKSFQTKSWDAVESLVGIFEHHKVYGNPPLKCYFAYVLACVIFEMTNYERSLDLLKWLKFECDMLDQLPIKLLVYMQLGEVMLKLGKYRTAYLYYQRALQLAWFLEDHPRETQLMDRLGVCQFGLGNQVMARYFHQRVASI